MDKSYKLLSFGMLALVFVVYNYLTGSSDAIGDTAKSMFLVVLASLLTWAIIKEQRKRGRMQ